MTTRAAERPKTVRCERKRRQRKHVNTGKRPKPRTPRPRAIFFPPRFSDEICGLVLGGTLNVAQSPSGTFTGGLYNIDTYTGTLDATNPMLIGKMPTPNTGENYFIQTSKTGEVNLFYFGGTTTATDGTTPLPYFGPETNPDDPNDYNGKVAWWDGTNPANDNNVDGGNGTWKAFASGSDNWTTLTGSINAPWQQYTYAHFTASSGIVTVDDSNGMVTLGGAEFSNTIGTTGYLITGGTIALGGLNNSNVTLDVTAKAIGTTTIASVLTNGQIARQGAIVPVGLIKAGALALTAANIYTGTTAVQQGTLIAEGNPAAVNPASTIVVSPNATFEYADIHGATMPNTIAGTSTTAGTLAFVNSTMTLTRDINTVGANLINNSTLTLAPASATTAFSNVTMTNNAVITFAAIRRDGMMAAGGLSRTCKSRNSGRQARTTKRPTFTVQLTPVLAQWRTQSQQPSASNPQNLEDDSANLGVRN